MYNKYACKHHPEWAVKNSDGTYDDSMTDLMSAYTDQELIPCLKELAGKYNFDGAWVDGEVWAVKPNFRTEELEEFYKESGYTEVESDKESASYLAFAEFWREKFRRYLKHYMTKIHEAYPTFDITSNFAFSHHMPECPIDEIDFLSGDTAGLDGRLCVRCYAGLGKPWDAMSYGFNGVYVTEDPSFIALSSRHIDRIQRDASMAISQGGGYQFLNNMTQKGEIRLYDLERMKQISDFVYERKAFNFRSKPMKNAAVLLSAYNSERRFARDCKQSMLMGSGSEGICDVVLDGGMPCDIIYEAKLDDPQRKTILVPDELEYIRDELKEKLMSFAKKGGNLIVCGRKPCKLLSDMISAKITDYEGYVVYTEVSGSMYGTHDAVVFQNLNAVDLMDCYTEMRTDAEKVSMIVTSTYGAGKVVFIGFDIMREYKNNLCFEAVEIMRRILMAVDADIHAYLETGIRNVEIIPATKDGKILVNLINTVELKYDEVGKAAGEIPMLYNFTVAVKCNHAPKKVLLEPEHTAAEFTYDGKYAHVRVDKLHIHRIITIE